MEREFRKILGEELANYLELLRTKLVFAEELYGGENELRPAHN